MVVQVQLVISPPNGANYMETLAADSPVLVLRHAIADKLGLDVKSIKLVCDSVELTDEGNFQGIANLSSIKVIHAAASTAASAPPSDAIITDSEMSRAIVVTNIPAADPGKTEQAIHEAFSRFGEITRIIFQDVTAASSQQHAVILFYRDISAAAALAADGVVIMGSPVRVQLANNLPGARAPPTGTGVNADHGSTSSTPSTACTAAPMFVPSASISNLIATGYLYGTQSVAHVKHYGEQQGLTHRVRVAVNNVSSEVGRINRVYHVTSTISAGYESAANQVRALDAHYKVVERCDAGLMNAATTLKNSATALIDSHPTVAAAVSSASAFISGIVKAVDDTIEGARVQVRAQAATNTVEPGAAPGPTALPPAPITPVPVPTTI